MKAIILVGGRATRLLPLTANTPKSLVPVVNVPILEHIIRHLGEHDIKEIVLAQGHLSQPIQEYFGDGSRFGAKIWHSYEDVPLGSAGAAKNAERYLDNTFLVLNSDIISDTDFTVMLDIHRRNKAKATIATTPVEDPTQYGLVETNTSGRVTRFLEKPKREEVTTNMINAGAWFAEADVLSLVPPRTNFSFERNVFPNLLLLGQPMYAYACPGYWIDMGTHEKYLQVHRDILAGKCLRCPAPSRREATRDVEAHGTALITGAVMFGEKCSVGARSRIVGPVVMGTGCVIEDQCTVEDSVLWKNVHVGRRATVTGSIVADNCRLEAGCTVQNAVLADNVTVLAGAVVRAGAKIEPGTRFNGA